MLRAIVPQIQQVQAACHTVHIALNMSRGLTPVLYESFSANMTQTGHPLTSPVTCNRVLEC